MIKHRRDTNGLDAADAIVIELGREIFCARKVASATFARALRQFGRPALVDLVALMAIMPGQQRFSPPSTCNSIQVRSRPYRCDEAATARGSTHKP